MGFTKNNRLLRVGHDIYIYPTIIVLHCFDNQHDYKDWENYLNYFLCYFDLIST